MDDPYGAFCQDRPLLIPGAAIGPLSGLTFAVKDIFDIAGQRTGAGNPDWLNTHAAAIATAPVIEQLVNVGATLVGRTVTDELTYSLNGENIHYGTPINPYAPGRIPGGSSSGSAVAVAGSLVDFSLGTDCAGSVRLPASYCGIYGFRPSHGRISLQGVMPLAPSFDTVGWFATDPMILKTVGDVFFQDEDSPCDFRRLLIATDAFALISSTFSKKLKSCIPSIADVFSRVESIRICPENLSTWMLLFRTIQSLEIWEQHGEWIREVQPDFAPEIHQRFEQASLINPDKRETAQDTRYRITAYLNRLLADDAVLCLPTTPGIAPKNNTATEELSVFRSQAISLLCIAGLASLPQINLSIATYDSCPLGLSLVGPYGSDRQLLTLAQTISDNLRDKAHVNLNRKIHAKN